MEGSLWKWTNYFSGWQKRYFVLEGEELSYYHNLTHYKDTEAKFLASIKVGRASSNIEVNGLAFIITEEDNQTQFYLQADNDDQKSKWLAAIGTARACALVISESISKDEKLVVDKVRNSLKRPENLEIGGKNEEFFSAPETQAGHEVQLKNSLESVKEKLNQITRSFFFKHHTST